MMEMIADKRGGFIWVMAILWIAMGGTIFGQDHPKADEGQILALENAWNQAELHHDPAALDLILTEDFVITEPDGTMQSKKEHLAFSKDPSYHYDLLVSEGFRIKVY